MEETMKDHWEWEGDELTEEKYIKIMLAEEEKQKSIDFEPCAIAKKVDVSGRDITHCDNLDKALQLTRSDDWTYKSICDKVLPRKLCFVHEMCTCFSDSNPFTYLLFGGEQWIRKEMQSLHQNK